MLAKPSSISAGSGSLGSRGFSDSACASAMQSRRSFICSTMGTYDRNHADPPSCAFSEIETSTASPFAISICVGKLIVFALCMRNAPWEKASRQSALIRLMKSRPGPYRLESFDLDAYGMKARFSKSSDNSLRSSEGTGVSTYFCERAALAMSWRSASHKRPSFICCSSIEVSLALNRYRRSWVSRLRSPGAILPESRWRIGRQAPRRFSERFHRPYSTRCAEDTPHQHRGCGSRGRRTRRERYRGIR